MLFEQILWTCYFIDENNKWSLIHYGFMKIFTVRNVMLTWQVWVYSLSKLSCQRYDINLTRMYARGMILA